MVAILRGNMKELYRLRYSVLKRSWGHLILWICWNAFLDQSLNIHHQQTKKQTNATEKVTNKCKKCGAKELLGSLDPVDLLECFCDSQKNPTLHIHHQYLWSLWKHRYPGTKDCKSSKLSVTVHRSVSGNSKNNKFVMSNKV